MARAHAVADPSNPAVGAVSNVALIVIPGETNRALELVARERGTTVQALLIAALDLVLKKGQI